MKLKEFERRFKDPETGEVNRSAAARALGVSRMTLYNWASKNGGVIPKPFDRLAEAVLADLAIASGGK